MTEQAPKSTTPAAQATAATLRKLSRAKTSAADRSELAGRHRLLRGGLHERLASRFGRWGGHHRALRGGKHAAFRSGTTHVEAVLLVAEVS